MNTGGVFDALAMMQQLGRFRHGLRRRRTRERSNAGGVPVRRARRVSRSRVPKMKGAWNVGGVGRLEKLRSALDAGTFQSGLADAKLLMLVDRSSGGMIGVTLFESEDAMRKADVVMNAGPGNAGSRSSVEFYEVPLLRL